MRRSTPWTVGTLLVLGSCLATPGLATDEAASPPPGYEDHLREFFTKVERGELAEAVDQLYQSNPWSENAKDKITQVKHQFATLPGLMGDYYGAELVIEHWISDRFVYFWYLARFDREPLSFHFTFYRPKDRWMLYSFEFVSEVQNLAKELGRAELIYRNSDKTPESAPPAMRAGDRKSADLTVGSAVAAVRPRAER
jgi:hypothetical protein